MTEIKLYNTKTRAKQVFTPLKPGEASMYVCGPTVYERAHLGNARPVLVFDILYRLLRHEYGADNVTYVRNFTDVDDKINARATVTGRDIGEITDETIGWFLDDMGALGALEPDHAPRATQYIAPMVAMIEDLIDKGHAYEAEGHALFRVRSYKEYGKLSGRSVDDMIAGARVEVAPYKEDPMDFVLWKPSTDDQPGWDSPWGRGRPGWHIECSAMAYDILGPEFDIHGGGNDLTFPHHENEIAQSKCAGHDFANIWMHNEMLQVEGKKMSKSLGNFFTVRDLLDQGVPGEVIRFVMLSTHYRKPMDWTVKKQYEANKSLNDLAHSLGRSGEESRKKLTYNKKAILREVTSALKDDLNFSGAMTAIRNKAKKLPTDSSERIETIKAVYSSLVFLGFDLKKHPYAVASAANSDGIRDSVLGAFEKIEAVDQYLDAIDKARSAKNYILADELKEKLENAGVTVGITPEGAKANDISGFDPSKLEALK